MIMKVCCKLKRKLQNLLIKLLHNFVWCKTENLKKKSCWLRSGITVEVCLSRNLKVEGSNLAKFKDIIFVAI